MDGDLQQGVRLYNYAFGSQLASDFAASNTAANSAATAIQSLQAFGTTGIDLVILYIGANDYLGNSNPATTFTSNLNSIISKYRTGNGSRVLPFLLVSHFDRWDRPTSPAPTYPWPGYKAAMKAVAEATTQCDYLDIEPWFPVSQATDTDGDLVDTSGVHLTTAGQGVAAQLIAQKLMFPAVV
jgi:lysophospholipase L1-like esterase